MNVDSNQKLTKLI